MNPLNRQWFYRGLRRRLVRVLGRTQAESVWENAGKEYQSMLSANAGLKKHKGAMVLPAVALYRALTAFGADAEDLLNGYGNAMGVEQILRIHPGGGQRAVQRDCGQNHRAFVLFQGRVA